MEWAVKRQEELPREGQDVWNPSSAYGYEKTRGEGI